MTNNGELQKNIGGFLYYSRMLLQL